MTRTEEIKTRLNNHFIKEIGVPTATPYREGWESFPVTAQHPFGWITPVPFGDPPLLVCFCPDVIAAQTDHLDDVDLNIYLTLLEYMLDRHIILFGDAGVEQNQNRIEEELLQYWPGAVTVMNDVQLRALDEKVN